MTDIRISEVPERKQVLDRLARIRVLVFRDWPYLFAGGTEEELEYLDTYTDNPNTIIIGAYATTDEGEQLIGAATAAPMEDHFEDLATAFSGTSYALEDIYYCGESVLLPEYRGLGIGHAFFDHREAKARQVGRKYTAFASVVRPDDHPFRPEDYRPLDAFWRGRGYEKLEGAVTRFDWVDVGEADRSEKPMQVWIKEL